MRQGRNVRKAQPFDVIYEDNHILALNKDSGLLSQGDATGDPALADFVKEYIRIKYNKPGSVFLGIVHRLDRPVSGLLLTARTSKALERLSEAFRNRKVKKIYWAITKKKPGKDEDTLTHYLVKDTTRNIVTAYDKPVDESKKAVLTYRLLGALNDHYLLEIEPRTGRPHQIRVQLSKVGCPIRGDIKYGFKKPNADASINLHARRLELIHPVKKQKMVLVAPLPDNEFWQQFETLDNYKMRGKNLDQILGLN